MNPIILYNIEIIMVNLFNQEINTNYNYNWLIEREFCRKKIICVIHLFLSLLFHVVRRMYMG